MKHFILSRFNLQMRSDRNVVNDIEWLDYRFEFFEKFTYPSIANQKNQDFKWVLFFDKGTSEEFVGRFEQFGYDNIVIKFCDSVVNNNELFLEYIREAIEPFVDEDESVITTRLDIDDAFHEDFVSVIQEKALQFLQDDECAQDNECALILKHVYYFDPSDLSLWYAHKIYWNNAHSLVERNQEVGSVYKYNHVTISRECKSVFVPEGPYSLVGVHSNERMTVYHTNSFFSSHGRWKKIDDVSLLLPFNVHVPSE